MDKQTAHTLQKNLHCLCGQDPHTCCYIAFTTSSYSSELSSVTFRRFRPACRSCFAIGVQMNPKRGWHPFPIVIVMVSLVFSLAGVNIVRERMGIGLDLNAMILGGSYSMISILLVWVRPFNVPICLKIVP